MKFQSQYLLSSTMGLLALGWYNFSHADINPSISSLSPAAMQQAQQNTLQNKTTQILPLPPEQATAPKPSVNPTPAPPATAPATAHSATTKTLVRQAHLWNLQNVEIKDIIEEVSRETGKNFLVDPGVQGKITVISSSPLNPDEVYQLFLSILQTLGYAAVPSGGGGIIKIMPNDAAKQQGLPMISLSDVGEGDQMVAAVVPIKNVSANDLVPILRPMMPNWANVSAYGPANSLIMTSSASNIQRMVQVIHRIDKATTKGIEIVNLQHANSTKLVTVINSLQGAGGTGQAGAAAASPNQVTLAADEDNNTILMSGSQEGRLRMRALISQLDVAGPHGQVGNTEVIYLRYSDAKKLAPILSKVAGAVAQQKGAEDDTHAKALIAAEPDNNALIITAPPTEMKSLIQIVHKLDVRPSEVLVEAIIVQIDENLMNRLGVIWGSIGAINGGTLTNEGGDSTLNVNSFAENSGTSGTSALNSVLPYTGIIRAGNLRIVASALQKDGDSNLLSTPDLMVLDNEKAKIEVGTQLSVQSGSYGSTGITNSSGSVQPFNTFTQENVGLELDVTPHISQGNVVVMNMSLENDALENPNNPGTTPLISTSGITTNVIVNSGDVLVMGGVISNTTQTTTTAIPWISKIPLIGWLFKYANNQNQKQNLMIFLRPVIVNDSFEGNTVSSAKYNYTRNQQLTWMYDASHSTKNFPETPNTSLLPHWGPPPALPKPFANIPPDYYRFNAPKYGSGSVDNDFPNNALPTSLVGRPE